MCVTFHPAVSNVPSSISLFYALSFESHDLLTGCVTVLQMGEHDLVLNRDVVLCENATYNNTLQASTRLFRLRLESRWHLVATRACYCLLHLKGYYGV